MHTVYQSTTHAIFYYIHTYTHTYLYKIIKHTFEKKNMPSCLWESNHVGTPFLFWGPRFFKPMGSQDPVFLTPSANTARQINNKITLQPTLQLTGFRDIQDICKYKIFLIYISGIFTIWPKSTNIWHWKCLAH